MEKIGRIHRSEWEHLKKVCKGTPKTCPYLVLEISTKKKFGLAKEIDGIFYKINLMHLTPPAKRSTDIQKPEPDEWREAEQIAVNLLRTCANFVQDESLKI